MTTTAAARRLWRHAVPAAASVWLAVSEQRSSCEEPDDEPTDCLLCRTHRQGPCRRAWLDFERCVKANEMECDEQVAAWQACWQPHTNLYILIALDVQQHDLPILANAKPQQPLSLEVDWRPWHAFLASSHADLVTTAYEELYETSDPQQPLWRRFSTEPVLVDVEATIPSRMHDRRLQLAWVEDQDGHVVGAVEPRPSSLDDNQNDDETFSILIIHLLPGMTHSIRIRALYMDEEDATASSQEQVPAKLYQSPVMNVPAQPAT